MNDTSNNDDAAMADGGFDPHEAARLLEQADREARRNFSLHPPLVLAFGAAVTLVAYGALWLSTRGRQPYIGPSLGVIALVYAVVVVAIAVSAKVYQRATGGVSGPATTQRKVEGAAILVSWLGSPIIQGALQHNGASNAIVYGVIPAAAPLIIVGTTVVAIGAGKGDWPQFGAALAAVIAGMVAAFAGPSTAWAVAGIGLFIGVAGYAAATAWQQHAASRI